MSTRMKFALKEITHQRAEVHFLKMCRILPYGGTLRYCKIGKKIVDHLDPIRWAILDAVNQDEDEEEDWVVEP